MIYSILRALFSFVLLYPHLSYVLSQEQSVCVHCLVIVRLILKLRCKRRVHLSARSSNEKKKKLTKLGSCLACSIFISPTVSSGLCYVQISLTTHNYSLPESSPVCGLFIALSGHFTELREYSHFL